MNKDKVIQKLAFEQGLSLEEATELVEELLAQDFVETGDSLDPTDDFEQDVANSELDMQISKDTGDENGFEQAENSFNTALANYRKSAKKVALDQMGQGEIPDDPNDPAKQHLDRLTLRANEEFAADPDVTPEVLDYARGMMADPTVAGGLATGTDEERDYAIFKSLLGKDPQQTFARCLAKWADSHFGLPASEGKLYRSTIFPRYFKSAAGNLYKLAFDPSGMGEGGAPAPAAPAPAVPAAPAAPTTPGNVSEQERQRFTQLMADAQANGRSHNFLLGVAAGFSNDQALRALAGTSEQELSEFEEGMRVATQARGGHAQSAQPQPAQHAAPATPAAPTGV